MTAYIRPGFLTRRVGNPIARLLGSTVLAVRGRQSGKWRTAPVYVLEVKGVRYLVSPRGETQWARNLRAAGEGELRRRGTVEPIDVTEVPVDNRPPIIDAYLERWGRVSQRLFDALPDPADHPVFRISAG